MLEADVQRACLDWLGAHGIFCWRQNQGAIPLPDGGYRRFNGMRGVSDILGILPQDVDTEGHGRVTFGNFLAVEVKRPGGRLTKEQRDFLREVNERGGLGICVHSVDELEEQIRRYL